MADNPESLSEQIRRSIDSCGLTRYRIWQETGVTQAALSRFMAGHTGLSLESLDKIGELLGWRLTTKRKGR